MATAKVFQAGNSQAVRLPKEFRFKSSEVEISRQGDAVILRERPLSLGTLLEHLPSWPDDIVEPEDPAPQDRPALR
jgi:antitoxin VapB